MRNKMWNERWKVYSNQEWNTLGELFGRPQTTNCVYPLNITSILFSFFFLIIWTTMRQDSGWWNLNVIFQSAGQFVVECAKHMSTRKKSFKVVFAVNLHLTTWSHLEMSMKTAIGYCLFVTCTNRKFINWCSLVVFQIQHTLCHHISCNTL